MVDEIGIDWSYTLFAGLLILLLPAPVVFYRYGVKIRAMSPYTPKLLSGHGRAGSSPVQGFPQEKV